MYTLKPPLKVTCLECRKKLVVKFCPPHQAYSQKNNWGTGKTANQKKYICTSCLNDLYHNRKLDYLASITDSKKRRILRNPKLFNPATV